MIGILVLIIFCIGFLAGVIGGNIVWGRFKT